MGKEIITFGKIEVEKHEFYWHKSPVSIHDVDVSKILASNEVGFDKKGFKYFIGYKGGKKVRTLCVMLPKMSAYRRDFYKTKYCHKNIEKGFDSEPVYKDKYLKTKMQSYERKINTNFLSVILIDCLFRVGKNYYTQVFLEERKYIVKENKMPKCITKDI